MGIRPPSTELCHNLLLSLLPPDDFAALEKLMERVPTPFGSVLFERDKPMEYAYFPCNGQHSILAVMSDGNMVEVGTVGREGMTNVDLILGGDVSTETTVCQVPGEAIRMSAADLRAALDAYPALRGLAQRYLQAYLGQVSQSVACNRLHGLNQRFARWVLMAHDRADGDEFMLTQEYLAAMLGVQRPSLNQVARAFQHDNIIRYTRGVITVKDRTALERSACECYGIVKKHYKRLLNVDM